MAGSFDGLISDAFKDCWTDAITELVRGCGVTATLIYGVTKFTDCPNCIYDPIGGKSSNRYETGGPIPFSFGICPMCAGVGKIPDEQTATVLVMPIYDYKSWIPGITSNIQSPYGFVQTLSAWSTRDEIRRAKEILIHVGLDSDEKARFERHALPEPCGLGNDEFIVTMWRMIESGT